MGRVIIPSLAKLNLDLRVLYQRADGFHELRTIFQTISLHDSLEIEYTRSRRSSIVCESSFDIPNNLVSRAAALVTSELRLAGSFRLRLQKQLPMGAGLGGGSSNAAAVLLALPALAGRRVSQADLTPMAATLGSDVPFFLYGGTALGLGRGTELYPLPDIKAGQVVVVAPPVHVSTAEAYASLGRLVTESLTSLDDSPILREFQTITWTLNEGSLSNLPLTNDFEKPVLERHPQIASALRKLVRLGARPARMTGSGCAVFGFFPDREGAQAAAAQFSGYAAPCQLVTRARYRAMWLRALGPAAPFCCLNTNLTS